MYRGIGFVENPEDRYTIVHSGMHRTEQTADIVSARILQESGRVEACLEWPALSEGNLGVYANDLSRLGEGKRHFTEVWFDEDYEGKRDSNGNPIRLNKSGKETLYGVVDFLLASMSGETFKTKNIVGIGHGPSMVLLLRELQRHTNAQLLPDNWRSQAVDKLVPFNASLDFTMRTPQDNALYLPLPNLPCHQLPGSNLRVPFGTLLAIRDSIPPSRLNGSTKKPEMYLEK
jgi:broad specificity phosphatase PhoE